MDNHSPARAASARGGNRLVGFEPSSRLDLWTLATNRVVTIVFLLPQKAIALPSSVFRSVAESKVSGIHSDNKKIVCWQR